MPDNSGVIGLKYFGLSPAEVEVLFNLLRDPFEVAEDPLEEIDESFVSMIVMNFPLAYEKSFFKSFGMDRWERVKEVLKNLKWRRGRRGVLLTIRFEGSPAVAFDLKTDDDKTFGKALETMEYLMDVILFQISSKILPEDVGEVSYAFDGEEFRWYPAGAAGSRGEYSYANGEWRPKEEDEG